MGARSQGPGMRLSRKWKKEMVDQNSNNGTLNIICVCACLVGCKLQIKPM